MSQKLGFFTPPCCSTIDNLVVQGIQRAEMQLTI